MNFSRALFSQVGSAGRRSPGCRLGRARTCESFPGLFSQVVGAGLRRNDRCRSCGESCELFPGVFFTGATAGVRELMVCLPRGEPVNFSPHFFHSSVGEDRSPVARQSPSLCQVDPVKVFRGFSSQVRGRPLAGGRSRQAVGAGRRSDGEADLPREPVAVGDPSEARAEPIVAQWH